MAGELVGWDRASSLLKLGDTHRTHRSIMHKAVGVPTAAQEYYPLIEEESRKCMLKCACDPENLLDHIRQ